METKQHDISTEGIWKDFKPDLERFIKSKVKDQMPAEDILQDVFIKIHLNVEHLENEANLKSWVFKIANNAIIDHYRKERFFVDSEKLQLPAEDNVSDNGNFERCMLPYINKLPEKYKKAIIHADLEKLDQKQLAEKLGISYSGAKSRVQRARNLLRSYFMKCCDVVTDKYGNIVSHEPKGKCLCAA